MKNFFSISICLLIVSFTFTAKSNDTTRYVFYFGASNTNINQDLNSKIKN